jgi:SAM-dependent methyltransferase
VVEARDEESAGRIRARLERGDHDPPAFRAALEAVPPADRDGWVDRALGLEGPPCDGPDLPRGCVPYLPCPVDVLLRVVELVPVQRSDVFVDVGSGTGRAGALVHLLSGARVIGLEIQRGLVAAARELASRLPGCQLETVEGDAVVLAGTITTGSVFFFYCPFSGERLAAALDRIEPIARSRALRICAVDVPLPGRPWLSLQRQSSGDLAIHGTITAEGQSPRVAG